jgi:hypothetical protein
VRRAVPLLAALACAPALRAPRPLPPAATGASAPSLLREAGDAFARRPDAVAVRRAAALYLDAAAADPAGTEGLLGAVRAQTWLAEHEPDDAERGRLAAAAMDAGQWCGRRAPGHPACHYALALALGLQARERHAPPAQGLKLMVEELRQAAAGDPRQDEAGPERVLALVLLRAPAWPVGPGDPETGLAEARRAVQRFPDHPGNQLALAEGLLAASAAAEGRAATEKALALARARQAVGDPDAADWIRQGEALLARSRRQGPP